MIVKLLIDGGDMKPGPTISQQLGPLGINIGKVISEVNQATLGFKGTKVPVELNIDPKTKSFTIKVSSPPVAELIKKELAIEKGSGSPNTVKVGNIALERIISIAKAKSSSLLAKDLKKSVKLIVGTCVSLGVLIDNKEAKEIEKDIDKGIYDKEIDQEITETSPEKKNKLADFFAVIKDKQEKAAKVAAEAKAAEEAAKAAAATTATSTTPGTAQTTTPAAAVKEEKKEKEEKPTKKK